MFFAVPFGNITEVSGIYTSKHYGAKNYKKMYVVYLRGLGISFLVIITAIIVFARIDLIFICMGFPKNSSELAYIGAWTILPYAALNSFNENLKS